MKFQRKKFLVVVIDFQPKTGGEVRSFGVYTKIQIKQAITFQYSVENGTFIPRKGVCCRRNER